MAKPRKSKSIENQRQSLQLILVPIKKIVLGNAGRKVDKAKVDQLAVSISDIGIQHPISVYQLDGTPVRYGLAAGQHRLAALKKLNFKTAPVIVMTRDEARAWKEAENLHRKDLGHLEKSISIMKYAASRLALVEGDAKRKGGKQPHDQSISATARALKMARRRVQRARDHYKLPMSVKKAVLRDKKLNKLKTLDELVKLKTEKEQLRYIQGITPPDRRKEEEMRVVKESPNARQPLTLKERIEVAIAKGTWRRSGLKTFLAARSAAVRAAFLKAAFASE